MKHDPAPLASAAEYTEAIEVLNPQGNFPALLLCDHASATLPDTYQGLGLPGAVLERHIGVDIGIAPVVRALSHLLDAPAILTRQSRLLIDCNRWIADPTSIPEHSDGVAVPGNIGLTPTLRADRQSRYFWPYHRRIHRQWTAMQTRHKAPVFLALHSFTRQLGTERRVIDAGTFWHHDRRLSDGILGLLDHDATLKLAENSPYCGFRGTSFTLDYHCWDTGLPGCGLEIVNDTLTTSQDREAWAFRLAGTLRRLAADYDHRSR
ncbi:MAG: N-formylglutamate amidohydrolase [Rhodobacteraceae bacterium]|nr:N-formylglutamate amidohydrolase [Paracoccaceae bacterium]